MAVALVALAAAVPARALDPAKQLSQFGHRSWTQQQGLPQDSVRAIAQAPDGALWLGTDEGLARFDGTDFTVFRQSRRRPAGQLHHRADRGARRIHLGRHAGRRLAPHATGRFTNYTAANGLGTPTVSDLFESQDGTIWAVGGRIVSAFRRGAIVNYGPEHGVPAEGLRKLVETGRRRAVGRGLCRGRAVRRPAVPALRQPRRADRRVRHVDHARSKTACSGSARPVGLWQSSADGRASAIRRRRRDTGVAGSRGAGRP